MGDGTIVEYSIDVGDRRRAEAALRESEERNRLIVEAARDYAIFTTDPEGRITSWSPGAREVYGWSAREIAGEPMDATFTPEDRAAGAPAEERAGAREHGSAPDVRWHLRRNGARVFIEGTTRALRDADGTLRGFLKIGQDVTERRHTEDALRQLNETLERRVAERTAELAAANRGLTGEVRQRARAEAARREVLRQLVTAEEGERRRISRELHDQMGQQVTGLLLGLKALEHEAGPSERVAALQRLADGIARDLQNMALQLRPPALDRLGLAPALQNHLDDWSGRYGIACDFHAAGLEGDRLPPEVETTVYRVVQEALTNVLKHAGATRVGLVLERRRGVLSAILEDDGRGFDVEATLSAPGTARRLGVRGMRERVALLGGTMEIESSPGTGTTLYVRIPDGSGEGAPPGAGEEAARGHASAAGGDGGAEGER